MSQIADNVNSPTAREPKRDILATAQVERESARIGLIRMALLAITALALHAWVLGAAIATLLVWTVYAAPLVAIGLAIRRHTSQLRFPAARAGQRANRRRGDVGSSIG